MDWIPGLPSHQTKTPTREREEREERASSESPIGHSGPEFTDHTTTLQKIDRRESYKYI